LTARNVTLSKAAPIGANKLVKAKINGLFASAYKRYMHVML